MKMLDSEEYRCIRLRELKRVAEQGELQKKLTTENTEKILALKDKHKGQRCFIVGGSPSLKQLDLTKLNNEYTFTVNRGFKLSERGLRHSNYHVMSDKKLFTIDKVCEELPVDFADIYFIYGINNFTSKVKNLIYFSRTEAGFQEDLTKPLWGFHTVIIFALQIACYMGFNNIYLIGVDWDFENFSGHAYVETDGEKERQQTTSIPEKQLVMDGLVRSSEFLKKKGINLYNASPVGTLNYIPRVKYEDLFMEETDV